MAKKFDLNKMIGDLKGQTNSSTQTEKTGRASKSDVADEQARVSMVLPADLWKKVKLLALSRGVAASGIIRDLLSQEIHTAEKKGEIPIL